MRLGREKNKTKTKMLNAIVFFIYFSEVLFILFLYSFLYTERMFKKFFFVSVRSFVLYFFLFCYVFVSAYRKEKPFFIIQFWIFLFKKKRNEEIFCMND